MYPFYYVDAFTDVPFEGNPCAVFPSADGLEEEELKLLAKETNLPETAFVFSSREADFKVRYFTPRSEVAFAGHPTIATAFLLAQQGRIDLQGRETVVDFEFNIGVLPVKVLQGEQGKIEQVGMKQQAPEFGALLDAAELAGPLGLKEKDLVTDVPAQVVSTGVPFLMLALKNVDAVRKVEMDRSAVRSILNSLGVQVMFAFCPQGFTPQGHTFARLLDPDNAGEDPYTGSATGCMGSFLYRYGILENRRMVCEQGHLLGRPGTGILELVGTPEEINEVFLFGRAVPSLKGTYEKA